MSFVSWLTGHDEKESDVYANYEKVDAVVTGITEIGNNEVASAKDAVHDAINSLNSVNGLSTYVGAVDVGAFDSVFEEITKSIAQIGELVESKANDIKTYSEAKWYEKFGSSFAMGSSKIGEGFLSVFEGIGDGVVSLVGWVAPKDSGVEKACANFVEKNWSHDAFNFYYKSEFAKKSTFTEDSAISGAFKIGGEALGYLAIGGFASGAGGAIASRTAGSVSKLGKAANAAGTFMSSTTKANTVIAGISGMGQGTESALQQGLSMDEAAWSGVKQGATQAAVAYGMGKLGEKSAQKNKDKAIENAQKAYDDVAAEAETFAADVKNGKYIGSKDTFKKQVADIKARGQSAKDALDAAKNIEIQGYNDAITKAGQKAGAKYANSVADNGFIKTTIGTPLKSGASALAKGGKTAVSGVKATGNAIRHPINTAKSTFASTKAAASSGASSIKSAASSAKTKIVDAATSAGKTVKSAAKTPIKSTINAAKTVASTPAKVAGKVIANPATAGVAAATLNATGSTMNSAYGSAMKSANNKSTAQFKISGDNPVKAAKNVDYNLGGNTGKVNSNPGSGGSSSTPSTGGGSSSTSGGGYSSRSGGGSYTPTSATPTATASSATTGNSSEQFKAEKTQNKKTKQVLVDKEVTRVPTKEPSTPTKTPNKPTNNVIDNVTPKPPTNNTPTNPTNTPSAPTNPSSNPSNTVTVTPSNTGGGTVQHTGGGYSGTSGYTPYTENSTIEDVSSPLESIVDETKTSIDDIVKGSKYTKIPTSSKPISTASSGSGGSAVIPVVAGLSAAAAAGVGAKVYMDRKKNNDNGEDDEIYTEEWNGDDTISLDYDDSSDTQAYLDDDDDYGYQEAETTEKYDARNNEELADLQ